ncbi:MAG: hypothetical protein V5B44_14915 [Candidatus Accumulibacter necessarius]|jgi:hypothetical protein|uniref:hypothetical protein n=1 Tax=Candidatus Accumulibacter necessarius TaxID=2954386 RepID=UPI002FC3328B
MAVQFQVAHSKLVRGAGVLAGGPYYCAEGSTGVRSPLHVALFVGATADRRRTAPPSAEAIARAGRIDPLEHLRDDRVWLLSGGKDERRRHRGVESWPLSMANGLPRPRFAFVKVPEAAHAMISVADPQAAPAAAPGRRSSTAVAISIQPAKCSRTCLARCSPRTARAR